MIAFSGRRFTTSGIRPLSKAQWEKKSTCFFANLNHDQFLSVFLHDFHKPTADLFSPHKNTWFLGGGCSNWRLDEGNIAACNLLPFRVFTFQWRLWISHSRYLLIEPSDCRQTNTTWQKISRASIWYNILQINTEHVTSLYNFLLPHPSGTSKWPSWKNFNDRKICNY